VRNLRDKCTSLTSGKPHRRFFGAAMSEIPAYPGNGQIHWQAGLSACTFVNPSGNDGGKLWLIATTNEHPGGTGIKRGS